VAGTYTIDLMAYGDGATWATNLITNTATFTTKPLTSPAAILLLKRMNEPTVMQISFQTDTEL